MNDSLFSPRGLLRALTPADRFVSVAVLVVAFALAGLARRGATGATHAVVTVGRSEVAVVPLDAPGATSIDGRLGVVVLEVAGGGIRVANSGCPHGICRAMGEKRRTGEMLACVPNALMVRLAGGSADPGVPDAVSR